MLNRIYQLVEMRLCLLPVTRKLAPHWDDAVVDHEDILQALHKRDGAALATILRDHVRHKAAVIHKAFEAHKPSTPPKRRVFQ